MPDFKQTTEFSESVTVRQTHIEMKGIVKHPLGFNPNALVRNITAAIDALAEGDGQTVLDFTDAVFMDGAKIKADKPLKSRKSYSFTVTIPVNGDQKGLEQQGAIHALAQKDGSLDLRVAHRKPVKKGKKAAAQPGEKGASPAKTTAPKKADTKPSTKKTTPGRPAVGGSSL
jgi:hypothetical protein